MRKNHCSRSSLDHRRAAALAARSSARRPARGPASCCSSGTSRPRLCAGRPARFLKNCRKNHWFHCSTRGQQVMTSRDQSNIVPMCFDLAAHAVDVGHRPLVRVDVVADRGVLRRQPEGVEAYGKKDVVAAHAHEARLRVRRRHRVPVPDVQVPDGYGNIVRT